MPKQSKNLILSLATDLSFGDYARFIKSARQHCPVETTDIVLLVNPMESHYIDLANQLQIHLIPVSNFSNIVHRSLALKIAYRLWLLLLKAGASLNLKGFSQIRRDAIAAWIHPICSRHFFTRDYLTVNSNYRCVLLSDSRDVVFQDDPFAQVNPNILNVFAHDPILKIGMKNIETEWINQVLGAAYLQKLKGKISVCCGTTMGSPEIILRYLDLMEQNIIERTFNVIDQVIHNKLVYLDLPKEFVEVHSNTSGVVLTLGEMTEDSYEVVNQQVTLNGKTVSILHQYDRIPSLKAMVEKLYDSQSSLVP